MSAKKVAKKLPAKKQPKKVVKKAPVKKVPVKKVPAKKTAKKAAKHVEEPQTPVSVINPPKPDFVVQRTWDDTDNQALQSFKRFVTAANAGNVDRDIVFIKGVAMYEIAIYDHMRINVINTFLFSDENCAKEAIRYTNTLDKP